MYCCITTVKCGSAAVFAVELATAPALAYLRDHVIAGRALMPGTG
jgi:hypothetical protein